MQRERAAALSAVLYVATVAVAWSAGRRLGLIGSARRRQRPATRSHPPVRASRRGAATPGAGVGPGGRRRPLSRPGRRRTAPPPRIAAGRAYLPPAGSRW